MLELIYKLYFFPCNCTLIVTKQRNVFLTRLMEQGGKFTQLKKTSLHVQNIWIWTLTFFSNSYQKLLCIGVVC